MLMTAQRGRENFKRPRTAAFLVAGDVDDGAAGQEPVEHGGGDGGVAEDVSPGVGAGRARRGPESPGVPLL